MAATEASRREKAMKQPVVRRALAPVPSVIVYQSHANDEVVWQFPSFA